MFIGPSIEISSGKRRLNLGDWVIIPSAWGLVKARVTALNGEYAAIAESEDPPAEWELCFDDTPGMDEEVHANWHCGSGKIKGTERWFQNQRRR